jgi:hypothetical protein
VPSGAQVPPPRAVVAPLRLGPDASSDATGARDLVEHTLADALARHATFQLLTRADVAALLGKAAQQQLSGCDAEGCLAEVADALDADLLVAGSFTVTPGLWNLQVSLIQRRTAAVVRRAGVRSRTLESLLASVDLVARQLCGSGAVDLKDPNLVARLGTTPQGARELEAAAQHNPQQDATRTWSDVIIGHNRESRTLALAQGGLLLVSGLSFLLAVVINAALVYAVGRLPTLPDGGPTVAYASSMVVPLPLLLVSVAALGGVLVLLTVDSANPGRLQVDRKGCCRDEELIRDAQEPGVLDRLGPVLAATGTLLGAGAPAAGGLTFMGLVVVLSFARAGEYLPPETFPNATAEAFYNARFCVPLCFAGWGCCLGGAGLLVASAMAAGTQQDMLDDLSPAPVAPPPKAAASAPPSTVVSPTPTPTPPPAAP